MILLLITSRIENLSCLIFLFLPSPFLPQIAKNKEERGSEPEMPRILPKAFVSSKAEPMAPDAFAAVAAAAGGGMPGRNT